MLNPKMSAFFKNMHGRPALTFDDVRLETGFASFFQHDVDLMGRLSRNVTLPTPIAGSAMSTVVGVPMAIALAKWGGIGSLPRSLDPEAQASAVGRVKHHQHGFIDEPITTTADVTVDALLKRRADHPQWTFDSFPVLDETKKLVGIMTHRDFKRCDDNSQLVGAVMTPLSRLLTSQEGVTKEKAYALLKEYDRNQLPVLRPDGTLKGLYTFSDLKRILFEDTDHTVDSEGRLRVAAAIGVGDEALLRAELLVPKNVDVLHIDMAHGAQLVVVETLRALKGKYRNGPDIVAGNVSNHEGAVALADAGADGVLVGQGGGSICTTRPVAGIGKPQVSAVWECASALFPWGVPVISDGGIRQSGDMVIALAAGACSVMVGNLLAGTDEAPGKRHVRNGQVVVDYYGMGSIRAMEESSASRQRYLHSQGALVPEGVEAVVPYKGPVGDILEQLIGGMRKGFHYVGARTLKELHEKAEPIWFSEAGTRESRPHDVELVRQPPNWKG